MKLTSREELIQLREEAKKRLEQSDAEETKIIIGMGTCGIAAGSQGVYEAVVKELEKRSIKATVVSTGCIGMCVREPLIDVKLPGKDRVTYGNLKPADIPRIIVGHVLHGNIVEDLAVARFGES